MKAKLTYTFKALICVSIKSTAIKCTTVVEYKIKGDLYKQTPPNAETRNNSFRSKQGKTIFHWGKTGKQGVATTYNE